MNIRPRPATILTIATALTAATIAGCTRDNAQPPAPAPATTPASPSPTSSAPPPASQPPAAHRLGQRIVMSDGVVDATVLRYQQPVRTGEPPDQAGHVWAAVDIRACVRKTSDPPVGFSEEPWGLVYPDGATYGPSPTKWDDFPLPEYPIDAEKITPAGRCVRGWIVFAVPKGKKPLYVEYAPAANDHQPIDWKL